VDKPKIKLELSDEDRKALYHGTTLDGIRAIRWQLGFGLKETKEIVERIKRGEVEIEMGKPSKPCPHCKGSGVAQEQGNDAASPIDCLKDLVEIVDEYLGTDKDNTNAHEVEARLESILVRCVNILKSHGVHPNVTEG
jgi:hypothetical protein